MITLKFLGQVLPRGIKLNARSPEVNWTWPEENINLTFRVLIADSDITVECDLEKYEDRFVSELYKRASGLARATVNMGAFKTGYGLFSIIDLMELPNGNRYELQRRENIPESSTTAFELGQPSNPEYDFVFKMVFTDWQLFVALEDLITSVTSVHTSVVDCGRVLERIRRMIAPNLNGAAAWVAMHRALNIDRSYQEWISKQSTGTRHGDYISVSASVNIEIIRRTWSIFNRFLEYRKGGNNDLTAPKFPILR